MKQNIYLAGFVFLLTILIKFEAKSQDIHYSQFYNSPLNLNPALTGIFNGDMRVIGSLRDQWRSNGLVPYTTFSGSYDMKYLPKKSDKYFYGFGGILNYDQAGDSRLNISDLNLTGSYNYLLNKNNVLSAGVLLGIATEGFNETELTWGSQWNGTEFDPALGSGEDFRQRFVYLETGAGANYRYQSDSSRTYANIGAGFFHIQQPSTEFIDVGNPRLPLRTALNGQLNVQLTRAFDIQAHAIAQFQGPYREYVLGGLAKLYVNQKKGKLFRIDLGASYRTSQFIAPTIAFLYNQIYVGASYDVNLGDFRSDFNGRGGPEVHVRYIITKVQALNQKPCPIY